MKAGVITAAIAAATMIGPMTAQADEQGADAQGVSQSTHQFVRDSLITTKVKARLAAEHLNSLSRIHVDTDADGVVYLSGTAQSQDAVDTAIRLARDTEHVRNVRSDVTVHEDN